MTNDMSRGWNKVTKTRHVCQFDDRKTAHIKIPWIQKPGKRFMRIIATTKWWDVATFALFSEPITFTSRHFLPLLLPMEVDILANVSSLNSNCRMPDNFFWGGIHIIGRLRHKCSAYGSKGQALNCQNALHTKSKAAFPMWNSTSGPSNFVETSCTHMFVVLGHITATRRQVLSVRPILSLFRNYQFHQPPFNHTLSQGSYFQTMSNT